MTTRTPTRVRCTHKTVNGRRCLRWIWVSHHSPTLCGLHLYHEKARAHLRRVLDEKGTT